MYVLVGLRFFWGLHNLSAKLVLPALSINQHVCVLGVNPD